MAVSLLRANKDIEEIYHRNVAMVYRSCLAYMKNVHDTEDMVQNTFVKLMKKAPVFDTAEHEKAWLLRTSINLCKDNLKHWWTKRKNIDDYAHLSSEHGFEIDEIYQAVMELPDRYKDAVLLHYYEGCKTGEMAEILSIPHATVRYHLCEARKLLKSKLGGIFDE